MFILPSEIILSFIRTLRNVIFLITLLVALSGCSSLTSPQPHQTAAPREIPGASCIPTDTERHEGKVTKVVDGDTIKVKIDGKTFTVRYIGIDTPESVKPNTPVQYFGKEASDRNDHLVYGKTVTLIRDVSQTDQYDRLLAYVLIDDVFVNYQLVYEGYATQVTFPPDVACADTFKQAEREARQAQRGLWTAP